MLEGHKVVLPAGLEPALGTNLVLLVYKTSDATLHYERKVVPTARLGLAKLSSFEEAPCAIRGEPRRR